MISKVKAHAIFKVNFTGSYEMLCSMITVTGHVTAYELRQFQRFASYGPWMASLVSWLLGEREGHSSNCSV